jgi:hypothetical protein
LEDVLADYVVDAINSSQTLLDCGRPGTAVFTLSGSKSEYVSGLVRWDGSVLQLDLSAIQGRDTAKLRLQLLNSDADTGTRVAVRLLENEVDPLGSSSPTFPRLAEIGAIGGTLDLAALNPAPDIDVLVENVRFSAATGRYAAELALENAGASIGGKTAVIFPGLPAGIHLRQRFEHIDCPHVVPNYLDRAAGITPLIRIVFFVPVMSHGPIIGNDDDIATLGEFRGILPACVPMDANQIVR